MGRVRIVNDTGRPEDTRVLDTGTGEPLRGVRLVDVYVSSQGTFFATLQVSNPELDLVAESEEPEPPPGTVLVDCDGELWRRDAEGWGLYSRCAGDPMTWSDIQAFRPADGRWRR